MGSDDDDDDDDDDDEVVKTISRRRVLLSFLPSFLHCDADLHRKERRRSVEEVEKDEPEKDVKGNVAGLAGAHRRLRPEDDAQDDGEGDQGKEGEDAAAPAVEARVDRRLLATVRTTDQVRVVGEDEGALAVRAEDAAVLGVVVGVAVVPVLLQQAVRASFRRAAAAHSVGVAERRLRRHHDDSAAKEKVRRRRGR